MSAQPEKRRDETPKGFKIPVRKRSAVLRGFKNIDRPSSWRL